MRRKVKGQGNIACQYCARHGVMKPIGRGLVDVSIKFSSHGWPGVRDLLIRSHGSPVLTKYKCGLRTPVLMIAECGVAALYGIVGTRSPDLKTAGSGVRDFNLVRTPDSLNAESGAIDPGLRTPGSLNAESGPGGASPGLGVTLSATINSLPKRKIRTYINH